MTIFSISDTDLLYLLIIYTKKGSARENSHKRNYKFEPCKVKQKKHLIYENHFALGFCCKKDSSIIHCININLPIGLSKHNSLNTCILTHKNWFNEREKWSLNESIYLQIYCIIYSPAN